MTDYTQFSNEQTPVEEPVVKEETVVTPEETADEPIESTPANKHVKVSVHQLNLREDVDGEVLTVLKKGTELEILEETGEWYMVSTSAGVEGFVKAEFTE